MSRVILLLIAIALLLPSSCAAQADSCRGALEALNRVKEQITPRLTPDTKAGNDKLQIMESTLMTGTRVCKEFPELWYYLMVVSHRLGREKDYQYAKEKMDGFADEGRWDTQSQFDPFTMPTAVPRQTKDTGTLASEALSSIPVRKKWALVVGIDQFDDDRVPKLDFAVKDSSDFADFLTDAQGGRFDPKQVFHLSNQNATLKGLKEALGKLRVRAKEDDLVVIYIASHGSPRESDPNGVSYIITHDTNLDNPATLYSSSLQMIDLVQEINREFHAHDVVLILDTCYSGGALESSDASPRDIGSAPFSQAFDNLSLARGRAVLTASRANERSWENKTLGKGGNGYFTHYLLEVLRESRGQDRLNHVFLQVSARVASHVHADLNANQNPSFAFSDEAEAIVLGAPEAQVQ